MPEPKHPPAKDYIATLEPFNGLGIDCITLVSDLDQAESAYEDLSVSGDVGFDTESKPTFRKGEISTGPHVLQFSTTGHAYIFQSHLPECLPVVMRLLESSQIQKIGFGLRGDLCHISNRFGIRPSSIHDLDRSFQQLGYRNAVGAKSAVAMLFERRLLKSKSVTTSNWGSQMLTEKQLIYAANDAYAALLVYHALRENR